MMENFENFCELNQANIILATTVLNHMQKGFILLDPHCGI